MTKNMTVGNPAKRIRFFTIPLLIGNLFQQLYNMADTLIVGRTIGVEALAAVGCTGSIMFLILGFTQGLTAGLSIVTAQRFGAGDEEGVRRSFAAGILIGGVITVFLTALSVALARPILILMRTPANIIDGAYSYIVVIYAGIAAAVLFNLLSSVLRALGDSRTPLIFFVHFNLSDGRGGRGCGNHCRAASFRRRVYCLYRPAFSHASSAPRALARHARGNF